MKASRIVSAGSVLGIAGLLSLPITAGAESSQNVPQGFARASALQLSVAPTALLSVDTGVSAVNALLEQVKAGVDKALGDTKLTVALDASNANGTLAPDLKDLATGHADSLALDVQFKPLDTLLSQLQAVLAPLGTVDPAVISALQSVPQVGPQAAAALQQVVAALGSGSLDGTLKALGINVASQVSADLANGVANPAGGKVTKNLVDLGLGNIPGLTLDLAPFTALAQNAAMSNGVPQAHAENTTTNLAVAPSLVLPTAGINLPDISSALQTLLTTLQQAVAAVPQGTDAVTTILNGAGLGAVSSQLGAITGPAAPVTGPVNGIAAGTQPVTSQVSAALQTLVSQVQSAIDNLGLLNTFSKSFSINDLLAANGVTSTATFHPVAGGVESLATSLVSDVSVLPLSSTLAGVFNTGGVLKVSAGTPLLHLHGINSQASAAFGPNAGTGASSHLSSIDVLGQTVVSEDQVNQVLDQGVALTKMIPGTPLTLIVTRGASQTIADNATEKHIAMSALDVRLVTNAASGGAQPNVGASQMHAAQAMSAPDGTVVELSVANSEADVTTVSSGGSNPPPPPGGCSSDCALPKTGMFGAGAFGLAGGLAAVAVLLQVVPRVLGRRRTVR